ncbi:HU family DNA-binding protein [Fusobacterium ulcerans]|uniref:HU family DNA-binding protein n=1 Tax=Fusobacterium ulcerans TaxID=861 RepID=UPI0026724B19|nr:HU family DNA-binding protein [Fusobacterium ulcerans]
MTEGEFIKFYKKRNKIKSHRLVKEKIDLFWNALFKALDEDKKVVLQRWGVFEKREMKSRKIKVPMWEESTYTKPKESIKFRAGLNFIKIANGDTDE